MKTKKPFFKKWWFWLIIVFVVIGVIGSQGNDSEPTVSKSEPAVAKVDDTAATEKPVETEKPTSKPTEEPKETMITEVGQTITTKNFKLTVESLDKPKGNDYVKPSEGNEFVEIGIILENISSKDYMVSSMLMFNAYQDSFSINEDLMAHTLDSQIGTMDGALAAGKKIRGKLAYQLPKDWKELEINTDFTVLSFSSDGEIKIVLQNK
ncbi:hypothetical protein M2444_003513 [Paenibacillus sp. PastF-3]|uniref:DUF4352 domain-containing protein n=1 Tax=Paenibacillus TaxID=44249 RepID=UPI000BA17C12|nr:MULTISPECIES: DUF4352 domain-containing protein [unclassified Paenibacillus]MDH6371714.1 hypothetical protein [Paenibacillus sp. PastF-3]OZQ86305.1 hypothetical protein CA598_18820 [Paenibacillus sp. VTT E-133291]